VERGRRRWAAGIIAGVLGLCGAGVAVSWLAAPEAPTGWGPQAERTIVDACERARGGQGRDGCRCAYDRLAAGVAWDRAAQLDGAVSAGEGLPSDVEELVAPCWAPPPGRAS
jgi:hypothetical protein